MHARVLPDEAAHSQYEMRSFVRSDSGVLYPTGQGRLAEASNPVPSSMVANVTPPSSLPGNVPGLLPKPAPLPKPVKEKPKGRQSTGKGARGGAVYPTPAVPPAYHEEPIAGPISNPDRVTVGNLKEDHVARQSRLNAYDDAIESVLRKVQETDDYLLYDQIASDFGNEDEPFVPPIVAAGRSLDRDEREAQIADTIDAVIARSFHESDQSPSPPAAPVGSPPPFDDEDEIIEVHSVSPLKVEVTTDDILILPPPSPPATSPIPIRTLAERKFVPEEEPKAPTPTPRRSKKPKTRLPAAMVGDYDEGNEFPWSGDQGKRPASPDLPSWLKFGIPESYVRLEDIPSVRKGRQMVTDAENVEDDVNQPLPMDAAESLMKLAGVAPPPKRLRISYGSGRERMVEDTRDSNEDYDPGLTSTFKPDLGGTDELMYRDFEEDSRRSAAPELVPLEPGQRSSRDERAKNRGRESTREAAEMHDVSAEIVESVSQKPAVKKGRPRKDHRKRGRAKKTPLPIPLPVISPRLSFFPSLIFLLLMRYVPNVAKRSI